MSEKATAVDISEYGPPFSRDEKIEVEGTAR